MTTEYVYPIYCKCIVRNLDCKEKQGTCESEERMTCKICLSDEIETVFLPCGHAVSCFECSWSIKTCVICRDLLDATVRMFILDVLSLTRCNAELLSRSHSFSGVSCNIYSKGNLRKGKCGYLLRFQNSLMRIRRNRSLSNLYKDSERCPFRQRFTCKLCFKEDVQMMCFDCHTAAFCVQCADTLKACHCGDGVLGRIYI